MAKQQSKRVSFGDPALPVAGQGSLGFVRKSRNAPRRAVVLVLLHLAIAAHATHWLLAGESLSPVEPSESMYTLELGQVNAGFVFFVVAILLTLVFGRFVCGWGCHLVALQDLCGWVMKRFGIRPQPFRSRTLAFAPFVVAFLMFVWPTLRRLFVDPGPPFPGFSNHLVTDGFWDTFPGPVVAVLTLLSCGFATVWFLGAKGFCTYACPYGAFFAVTDRLSPMRIVVTDDCEQCGHCTATCTSNVRVHEEVARFGRVVDPGCMKCLDCVSVCPKNALSLGFARPAFLDRVRGATRRFGLGLGPELAVAAIALVSALIFRGLYKGPYGGPGLLMATALGGITAFIGLKSWQLIRRPTLRLHRFVLKDAGRLTSAGIGFAVVATLWLALTAHSGLVEWSRERGTVWLNRTEATRDDVFGGARELSSLSVAHHQAAERAHSYLGRAHRWALVPTFEVEAGLAWTSLLRGELDEGLAYLQQAIDIAPDNAGLRRDAVVLYLRAGRLDDAVEAAMAIADLDAATAQDHFYRAGLLTEAGRPEDAIEAYRDCLARVPDAGQARYNLGGLLRRQGRNDEALTELLEVQRLVPGDRDTQVELGLTYQALGDRQAALRHLQRAIALAPDHPESQSHLPSLIESLRLEDD
ncbi:tetratricopeptide repeat protein [bacterium]|nr:tetratricopeptide repeat protein [bacterium]